MRSPVRTAGVFAGLATVIAGSSWGVPRPDPPAVTVVLEQIKEVRKLEVVPKDDDGFSMFDKPGLVLHFGMTATGGRTIIELREPAAVEATDSTGADLSDIPMDIFDQRDFVETVQEWDKPPGAFTFTLGLPARTATSFSLGARLDAVTFLDTVEETLRPTTERTEVSSDAIDGSVRMWLEEQGGSVHLVFAPGTVKEQFAEVRLGALESQGAMWNDQQVAYMFDGTLGEVAPVATVTIRRGLEIIPVEITVTDQALP